MELSAGGRAVHRPRILVAVLAVTVGVLVGPVAVGVPAAAACPAVGFGRGSAPAAPSPSTGVSCPPGLFGGAEPGVSLRPAQVVPRPGVYAGSSSSGGTDRPGPPLVTIVLAGVAALLLALGLAARHRVPPGE
jgi:hypothetical protein